jgi:hypothetical protein
VIAAPFALAGAIGAVPTAVEIWSFDVYSWA